MVRSVINSPDMGSIHVVGFQQMMGGRIDSPVRGDPFNNYFIIPVPVKIPDGGVVQFIASGDVTNRDIVKGF